MAVNPNVEDDLGLADGNTVCHSVDSGANWTRPDATWQRFNDDAHQFGGMNLVAGDQNVYGRVYSAGGCRGMVYSK